MYPRELVSIDSAFTDKPVFCNLIRSRTLLFKSFVIIHQLHRFSSHNFHQTINLIFFRFTHPLAPRSTAIKVHASISTLRASRFKLVRLHQQDLATKENVMSFWPLHYQTVKQNLKENYLKIPDWFSGLMDFCLLFIILQDGLVTVQFDVSVFSPTLLPF